MHFMLQYMLLRDDFYLTATTKIFVLNLAPETRLTVNRGFFHNNQVQRLQVTGGKQFELASNAMDGNVNARFPQIEIVGCDNIVFGSFAFHGEFVLNVTSARAVIVFPEAFSGTSFQANFVRIADLRIQAKAFSGANASSRLHVYESKLDDLEPLQTSLKEIRFERSQIGTIEAQAFDVTEVNAIDFCKCQIGVVKSNAFTDKVKLGESLTKI